MKLNNRRLIGLLTIALVQISFPLIFIASKEGVISTGKEYLFEIQPVDPYDFFQGRYVNLNMRKMAFKSDKLNSIHKNDIVYVAFKQDSTGAKISSISTKKTAYSLKLKMFMEPYQGRTFVRLPFNRFYLEEFKAQRIEAQITGSTNKRNFVHVKIKHGEFVITDISQNGISLVTGKKLKKPLS